MPNANSTYDMLLKLVKTRMSVRKFRPDPIPEDTINKILEAMTHVQHINTRQGPRNVDLRTPPGPEGSNGSLLDICRGHPGISFYDEARTKKKEMAVHRVEIVLVSAFCILHSTFP